LITPITYFIEHWQRNSRIKWSISGTGDRKYRSRLIKQGYQLSCRNRLRYKRKKKSQDKKKKRKEERPRECFPRNGYKLRLGTQYKRDDNDSNDGVVRRAECSKGWKHLCCSSTDAAGNCCSSLNRSRRARERERDREREREREREKNFPSCKTVIKNLCKFHFIRHHFICPRRVNPFHRVISLPERAEAKTR